ncbi:antibiotic biosynthesis monooxygenase family protein [Secundilactobacillus paracollinoides]|uniref:ABM domain-containing protein n=1 Tax=Secundilactobacillus paracollinoides TaxID=240427 RepID=A0A1B2IWC2_9LACO|nr:hypothetical protein [Secundilactobacillus paracollinoides]ANZ60492.1 hypothetical protein AYR61_03455 [Secundilactobacillus paracollinoides]ANZ66319.1 hypothetical protein AYR63_03650 [Secundilactobacillus paracollinoides]
MTQPTMNTTRMTPMQSESDDQLLVATESIRQLTKPMPHLDWVWLTVDDNDQLIEMPISSTTTMIESSFDGQEQSTWGLAMDQPAMFLKLNAEYEHREDLLTTLTEMYRDDDAGDQPVAWMLCRSTEDADIVWALEFYEDEASMQRHFKRHMNKHLFDLLAKMPEKVTVHVALSGFEMN